MIELHSYDMDLLFHKVSSKYVEDNATTLQMMGLTKAAGIIFQWYETLTS